MMSEYELKRLAKLIVIEQANNEEWMLSFARAQSKLQDHGGVMVSAKKAADMLGISVWQLYRIKDDEKTFSRLGRAYADMFLSTWEQGSYSVVYFENGENAWHIGAEAADDYRWKDAMDAWMTLLGTKNMLKLGCAEYNIALACYMLGQKSLAIEWLDKADEDYFIAPSVELRRRIVG